LFYRMNFSPHNKEGNYPITGKRRLQAHFYVSVYFRHLAQTPAQKLGSSVRRRAIFSHPKKLFGFSSDFRTAVFRLC